MANRKQHSGDAGYVAERMNPFVPGTKVVICEAEEQGIDTGGDQYAVVCDAHAAVGPERSLKSARVSMKRPDNFCDACRIIEAGLRPRGWRGEGDWPSLLDF